MTREELYHKFGPLLLDAVTQIIKDEMNLLRSEVGLPPRTNTQLINAISDKLESMPLYVWMLSLDEPT